MKPNAVRVATARPVARLLALGLALFAAPALAGDRAMIDYFGYSADGRYFAFEEFGIQDGSGFPYANIYIIDLPADAWVGGSPYRVTLEDEEADVGEAREAAFDLAEARLDGLGVDTPAFEIAHNADGETGDGHSLSYGTPGYGLEPPQGLRELELMTFAADAPEDCELYLGESASGFTLKLDGTEIYADPEVLPRSRGCPLDYRIHAVVTLPEWTGGGSALAIIASYPFGFEGPDRRFLVVPLPAE